MIVRVSPEVAACVDEYRTILGRMSACESLGELPTPWPRAEVARWLVALGLGLEATNNDASEASALVSTGVLDDVIRRRVVASDTATGISSPSLRQTKRDNRQ